MTRSMNARLECPTCRCQMSMESHFERWMRECKLLDSRQSGIVRYDLDLLLHKYMIAEDSRGARDIQAMMFVEVKTYGAEPTQAQADTLHLLNQVLRNRRKNMHTAQIRKQAANHAPLCTAFSLASRKQVALKLLGGHLLQFSDNGPEDSEWIRWDKKYDIDKSTLVDLLTFKKDPDTLLKLDIRRRTGAAPAKPLFDT